MGAIWYPDEMGFHTSQHQLFDAIEGHRVHQVQDALAHGARWDQNMYWEGQVRFEYKSIWRYTAAQKAVRRALEHGRREICDLIEDKSLVQQALRDMTDPDMVVEQLGVHEGGGALALLLTHWPHAQDWKTWQDPSGYSLLMRLVMTGKPEKALALLGVDTSTLETRDPKGRTALYHCKSASQIGVLLLAGADLHVRDQHNRTPLEVAVDRLHSVLGKGSGVVVAEWDKLEALCGTRHLMEHPDRYALANRIESAMDRAFNRTPGINEKVVPQLLACAAEQRARALAQVAAGSSSRSAAPGRKM